MPDVITIENLGKRYLLSHQGRQGSYQSLRELLTDGTRDLGRRLVGRCTAPSSGPEEFWALKEVDFQVRQGDRVGIIGRNGAGKSTLLKILSRICEPTTGSVRIRGRVASLLEVGTGFHPELTGRENIFLNGAILGMGRLEIRRKFDEIVDFAEIERFLDTPVKRYSSGMYVRLAFAVAAHLEPEILVVDEVLAVGDLQFQKKCLGKMEDVSSKEQRTVLFVSHNMGAVTQLCQRGLLFQKGRLEFSGTSEAAVKRYVLDSFLNDNSIADNFSGSLADTVKVRSIAINGDAGNQVLLGAGADLAIVVEGECLRRLSGFVFSFSVYKDDVRLFTQHDTMLPKVLPQGKFRTMVTLPRGVLRPGEYTFAFGGHEASSKDWFYGTYLKYLVVEEGWSDDNPEINYGLINVKCLASSRICNGDPIC
jgi:lipopolysaccharide transport system ATP-binding protein